MKKRFAAFALALLAFLSLATAAEAACYNWSTTAATNAGADPTINWAEGMAPSSVNDSARSMMARLAECRGDESGSLQTTGTSTAYALATFQVFDTLAHLDGKKICFRVNATNGSPVTLNVDTLGAKPLRTSPAVEVPPNSMILGSPYCATYNNSDAAFYLVDFFPLTISANTITTAMLQNSAVTYAKIQNETTNTILGNATGAPAAPSELTIGNGLSVTGSTISAPAFPPQGAYRNLAIKVLTNTTGSLAADFITVSDGTNYKTLAFSCTINMGTTGANALDAGTIATATWYALFAIAKADNTTACLASTSSTAPTMPSGYTFKARMGWWRTSASVAQLLGTYQFGNRARYIYNLAQTSTNVGIATGTAGSVAAPTWVSVSVSNLVPPTAVAITIKVHHAGGTIMVAPNGTYGAAGAAVANAPPIVVSAASSTVHVLQDLILESTNVFWASDTAAQGIVCDGWIDNL